MATEAPYDACRISAAGRTVNTVTNQFGSPRWTTDKLEILRRYLCAYTKVMKAMPFELVYVDAFAGTGTVDLNPLDRVNELANPGLIPLTEEEQADILAARVVEGSARIALGITHRPFDRFILVELNSVFSAELRKLKSEYSHRKIQVVNSDANQFLQQWCTEQNRNLGIPWRGQRAVAFLDPYATQVDWQTVESIADTKSVDLWVLFPVWALTRTLPKFHEPDERYAPRLDRVFGGREWRNLYKAETSRMLLPLEYQQFNPKMVRDDQKAIVDIYMDKMRTKFAKAAPEPRWFRNSRKAPLFALMFAASNPRGASIAVDIAKHLLDNW